MIARRGHRACRPAAWLALLAILLQVVLLPIGQHPAGAKPAGLDGDTVAGLDIAQNLCRAGGDSVPADPGKAPADHHQCCGLCLAAHALGSFTPPPAPIIAVSHEYNVVAPFEAAFVLPPLKPSLRQQQPRPPPVFI